MSPAKSCDINGPRPSPLFINNNSRILRKPSNYSDGPAVKQQLRQPVIIYTHSPKIIHTQPKDFMALVQRLTGFTPSNVPPLPRLQTTSEGRNNVAAHNDNDSSSVLTEENCGDGDGRPSSSYGSPMLKKVRSNSYFADIPLFTPLSADLFGSPNLGNFMSPSLVEFLKGLPEF